MLIKLYFNGFWQKVQYFSLSGSSIAIRQKLVDFYYKVTQQIAYSSNGMISLTFASFKAPRDAASARHQITKKHELPPATFKALAEIKDNQRSLLTSKRLDNQENTHVPNTHYQYFPRKQPIKLDKSTKKIVQKPIQYRSPCHKPQKQGHPQSKITQLSSYKPKGIIKRQQASSVMTPNLQKVTRSFAQQNLSNHSFLTQKQRTLNNSEQGSVGSITNSFNDSFQLFPSNRSYEEQQSNGFRQKHIQVNTSIQLPKQPSLSHQATATEFPTFEMGVKSMKKSTHIFCNNDDPVLKDVDEMSVNSVTSSFSSIKISDKFQHYKKRTPLKIQSSASSSNFALKDFKLVDEIGSGKYGQVYLAIHRPTNFICALKSVSKQIIKAQNLQTPFMREVKIQLCLNHPNIVKLYGLFHDTDNVYLVMEYCSGQHLYKLIQQRKSFTEHQILQILSNLYESVAYIHCHGVIHRDIKPENVVIQHGVYKLCDFGWAAYACGDTRTTFCGTPLYVCPEVIKGEEYNEKADVWGLGIVTYELTFGRVPFSIMNQSDLMKIIKDPVYFPVWGQASEKLVPFVRRMLSKYSSQRPSLNEILGSQLFTSFQDIPDGPLKHQLQLLY